MDKKDSIQSIIAVVLLILLVVLFVPNKSMSRYYYNLKEYYEITDSGTWNIQIFETAFRKAIEADGIKVSDCFISGSIPDKMEVHVLTQNNDYFHYIVDVGSNWILSPDIIPVYYANGLSLYLDTNSTK